MNDELDRGLKALFAEPEREPDEAFAARVRWSIIAGERIQAQRQALRRRAVAEAAATSALVASFALLVRVSPLTDPGSAVPLSSPIMAGLMLLMLGMIALTATPPLKNADPH
jgi:hypothetical protein